MFKKTNKCIQNSTEETKFYLEFSGVVWMLILQLLTSLQPKSFKMLLHNLFHLRALMFPPCLSDICCRVN